jgi:GAF domain-containing protein
VSASEILDELPRLTPAELETIYRRAAELHQGISIEPSLELLAAIDEADQSFSREGGVSVDEARRIAASWNTK